LSYGRIQKEVSAKPPHLSMASFAFAKLRAETRSNCCY